MPQVAVLDQTGKPKETLELKPEVFGVEVRVPLLHQAVTRELAALRAGTHDT
ncbi:MAG: 50S ribosomal protein L4, partial [Candidatus Rokubacteria bacterium RIFCSPHIGHO2_02_FULL_69_13]